MNESLLSFDGAGLSHDQNQDPSRDSVDNNTLPKKNLFLGSLDMNEINQSGTEGYQQKFMLTSRFARLNIDEEFLNSQNQDDFQARQSTQNFAVLDQTVGGESHFNNNGDMTYDYDYSLNNSFNTGEKLAGNNANLFTNHTEEYKNNYGLDSKKGFDHFKNNQFQIREYLDDSNNQEIAGFISPAKHLKDNSVISSNTFLNIQQFQEQHFVELKFKLEAETIKNEKIERKLKNLEFDQELKIKELKRKNQELELINEMLSKQIQTHEKLSKALPIQDSSEIVQTSKPKTDMEQISSARGSPQQIKDEINSELEKKLIFYENEILLLKERETDLLSQLNSMRSENFELRLKTERFSFLANKEQQYLQQSPRKTYNQAPMPRTTFNAIKQINGQQFTQTKSNDNLSKEDNNALTHNKNLLSINSRANIQNSPNISQMMRLTMNTNNHQQINFGGGISQRVSMISYGGFQPTQTSQFAKINNESVNLEQIIDIGEAQTLILMLNQEKEQLEQEMEAIKETAINQILEKERQIIEFIQSHEVQTDEIRQENFKMQLEIKTLKNGEKNIGSQESTLNKQFEQELNLIRTELKDSEEKYDKLFQKYLEERRYHENDMAKIKDKYDEEIYEYESKIEKLREKNKKLQDEKQRENGKYLQSQDFKQEIIKELEDYEYRLKECEADKQSQEKDFKQKLDAKSTIISEKNQRIQDLQNSLIKIERDAKRETSKDIEIFMSQIKQLQEQLKQNNLKISELENELETCKNQNENLDSQIAELKISKKMMSEMVTSLQQKRKEIEENYKDKIYSLESQIQSQQQNYIQQIQSLKSTISMLENSQNNNDGGYMMFSGPINLKVCRNNGMRESYRDEEQEGLTQMSEVQNLLTRNTIEMNDQDKLITFNSESTQQIVTTPKKNQLNLMQSTLNQGLSLMDELCDDQYGFNQSPDINNNNGMTRPSHFDTQMSPRPTIMSGSQMYGYNNFDRDDDKMRATYQSNSLRPSFQINPRDSFAEQFEDRNSVYPDDQNTLTYNYNTFNPNQMQKLSQSNTTQDYQTGSSTTVKYQNNIFKSSKGRQKEQNQILKSERQSINSMRDSANQVMGLKQNNKQLLQALREQGMQTDSFENQEIKELQSNYKKDIEKLQDQISDLNSKITNQQNIIQEMEGQAFMKDTDMDLLRSDCDRFQNYLEEQDQENLKLLDSIELYVSEINKIKESKEEQVRDFQQQIQQFQERSRADMQEIQSLRRQNIQMKSTSLTQSKELQASQLGLQSEIQKQKNKIKSLEKTNDDILEQLISNKQIYSSQNNRLRIELSTLEDTLMNLKLTLAQTNMEKDMLYLQYKDLAAKNNFMRDRIIKSQVAQHNQSVILHQHQFDPKFIYQKKGTMINQPSQLVREINQSISPQISSDQVTSLKLISQSAQHKTESDDNKLFNYSLSNQSSNNCVSDNLIPKLDPVPLDFQELESCFQQDLQNDNQTEHYQDGNFQEFAAYFTLGKPLDLLIQEEKDKQIKSSKISNNSKNSISSRESKSSSLKSISNEEVKVQEEIQMILKQEKQKEILRIVKVTRNQSANIFCVERTDRQSLQSNRSDKKRAVVDWEKNFQ